MWLPSDALLRYNILVLHSRIDRRRADDHNQNKNNTQVEWKRTSKIYRMNPVGLVKLFIPDVIFNRNTHPPSYLYGHCHRNVANAQLSYYILESKEIDNNFAATTTTTTVIGQIQTDDQHAPLHPDATVLFSVQPNQPNILLDDLLLFTNKPTTIQIIIFDIRHFCNSLLNFDDHQTDIVDDDLLHLAMLATKRNVIVSPISSHHPFVSAASTIFSPLASISGGNNFVLRILRETAVARHLLRWHRRFVAEPLTWSKSWAVICDVFVGIVIMVSLLHYEQSHTLLIHSTEVVVEQLRQLLAELKGFPIGLKLNVQLNSFFLDIFTYHIDLWATFLSKRRNYFL